MNSCNHVCAAQVCTGTVFPVHISATQSRDAVFTCASDESENDEWETVSQEDVPRNVTSITSGAYDQLRNCYLSGGLAKRDISHLISFVRYPF